MASMDGTKWKVWAEIHPSVIKTSVRPSKACLGFWLALKLIASQNNPNVGLNLPLATHPTYPPLINATRIKVVVKKLLNSNSVSQLAESYKTLGKRLFQLYSISSVAISTTKNHNGFNT